jgi:hypothetical protein
MTQLGIDSSSTLLLDLVRDLEVAGPTQVIDGLNQPHFGIAMD